jgi:hypothetical protein
MSSITLLSLIHFTAVQNNFCDKKGSLSKQTKYLINSVFKYKALKKRQKEK